MIQYYLEIKLIHVACVLASGGLFAIRALGAQAGARWPLAWPVSYLSYAIDTTLLTAALMLSTMLRQYPFVHAWLTVKVTLLVGYVVLGSFALKRARTLRARRACLVAAIAVYAAIYATARSHDPLGSLRWLVAP